MRISLPILVFLCLAAACGPPSAAAQERAYASPVSRAELARSGATDLLSALTELRPSWLSESVIVYLDGRHLGDLQVLSTLDLDAVAGVRLVSEHYVRRTDTRYPRTPFTAAIWVSTRSPRGVGAARSRNTFTLYAVAPVLGMHSRVDAALADAGWNLVSVRTSSGVQYVEMGGVPYSPGIGANASLAAGAATGVELQAEYLPRSATGRFSPRGDQPVGASYSWIDAAALATYRNWPGRYSLGPVVRLARWEWGEGFCGCDNPASSTSTGLGVAGNATAIVPVGRTVHVEVRLGLRHFFSHEVDGYRSVPALDLSGTEGVFSLGLGLHR